MLPEEVWIKNGKRISFDRIANLWNERFAGGAFIWITKDWYDTAFGCACFEVSLPEDAMVLWENSRQGWAFYVPKPIEPERFRLVAWHCLEEG